MRTVDIIAACVAVLIVVVFTAILARQRYMLRSTGALALAMQRGNRWLYGVARYQGGELRFYRALGVGTRPTRVLRRGHVQVVGRRAPYDSERGSLPATVVVVECRIDGENTSFALSENAFTGFVSWLESAPI
jgi:hypothetical protein